MEHYTITRTSEEGACEACGWPLYLGDRAVLSNLEHFACSNDCARYLDRKDDGHDDARNGPGEHSHPGQHDY